MREHLSRSEFEQIIRPEASEIERCVDRALAAAGVEESDIDVVVRTGGSSLIPLFQRMLALKFGGHKLRAIDEFSSVTAGLAVAGHLVERGQLELRSYGPEILEGRPVVVEGTEEPEAPGARPAAGAPALISPVLTLSQELAEQETFQAYQASEEYAALQRELAARPQAIVSLSCGGEIRRTPMARCLAAHRGAPSVVSMALAPEDEMTHVVVVGEGDTLLVVTDRGRPFEPARGRGRPGQPGEKGAPAQVLRAASAR